MAVTETLTDEECYLLSILTDPSGLDFAEFGTIDEESPDSCFRAWPFQWAWWRDESPLQIDQCVAAGQLVLTSRGHIPIEDVLVGDLVLTHQGRWRRVLDVQSKGVQSVVKVKGQGHPGLFVTPDHRIYARRSRRASQPKDGHKGKKLLASEWLSPQDWEWNDGSGKMHANWGVPVVVEALELPDQMVPAYRSGPQNYVADYVTEAWMWLYGLFLAEGSTYIEHPQKGLIHRAGWSVHTSEVPTVESYLQKVGLKWSVETVGSVSTLRVNSKPVTLWLKTHAGHRASGKHIAPWVFGLPESLRRAVWDGATFGDGSIHKDKRRKVEANQYTTVSRDLAVGLRLLGLSLGKSVSFSLGESPRTTTIQGRAVNCRQKYVVEFRDLKDQQKPHVQIVDGAAWGPVVKVEPAGLSEVYDLEVEEDHSFVVEGIAVHNCARAVGKTRSIIARAMVFPFCHPGQEMVITAPELVHLEPVTSAIERQFYDIRLTREMLPSGRSAVTHRPFQMNLLTGSRIIGRIPQLTGRGVKGCVAEGTLILAESGYKPVESLAVGELVLTHTGEWKPVVRIEEDINDCYEVRGQGSHPIIVSSDHRFFGAENLAGPKEKRRFSELTFCSVDDLIDSKFYWATPTSFDSLPIPELEYYGTAHKIEMHSIGFWWFVGRYLADGFLSMNSSKDKERRVCIIVHPNSGEEMRDAVTALGKHMGQRSRLHSSADEVSVCSAPLYRWLAAYFGQHAGGKRIPGFVLGLPRHFRQALLDGYLAGDGSKTDPRPRITASSASQALILGIQMVAQSLGLSVNCSGVQPPVTHIMGVALKKAPQYAWRIQITPVGTTAVIDQFRVGLIKRVTTVGKRRVFNPIVEDNHTYISNSIVSHNTHPIALELDEASDYPADGWTELIETLKRGSEGAVWRAHGVTRGIRDKFWEFTQDTPDNKWKIHRWTAMHRPNWTDEERQEKIRLYGSKDAPDYRRNILGLHGDASNPIFVLKRLMSCADSVEASKYNRDEYQRFNIKAEHLYDIAGPVQEAQADALVDELDFLRAHKSFEIFWIGQDVGFTQDPSEILIFAEYLPSAEEKKANKAAAISVPEQGQTRLKLVTRITLHRISHPLQIRVIEHVINFYQPRAYALDKTGNGLPLFQDIQKRNIDTARVIRGYNFSEKVIVDIDGTVVVDEKEDPLKEAAMKSNVLERSTDVLRDLVDNGRLLLPWDTELLREFQGQTFSFAKTGMDAYGRRRRVFSQGSFHALDAARMAAMAHSQHKIEEFIENQKENFEPVLDVFISAW